MYSPAIVERNIENLEQASNIRLERHSVELVAEMSAKLQPLRQPDGRLARPLTREEQEFIRSEVLISKYDFRYWFERYYTAPRDGREGGGVGKLKLWESQELLLRLIAKAEQQENERFAEHGIADGILIVDHKDRQIGHTGLCRALVIHRVTLWLHERTVTGSIDEKRIESIYEKDKLALESLPWWMSDPLIFDVKSEHLKLQNGSTITYLQSNMKQSFGQSFQFDVAHLTECSEWPYPAMIEVDLLPTLPQSPRTLCILESRANGRQNWWCEFSESVRRGRKLRWRYSFIPWYAEKRKYCRVSPAGWTPTDLSMAYARRVHETSAEFIGRHVYLPKEQLYWWETTRQEYIESDSLNLFLTNYAATPEESFQHTGGSAFSVEVLEKLRDRAMGPVGLGQAAYEFEAA